MHATSVIANSRRRRHNAAVISAMLMGRPLGEPDLSRRSSGRHGPHMIRPAGEPGTSRRIDEDRGTGDSLGRGGAAAFGRRSRAPRAGSPAAVDGLPDGERGTRTPGGASATEGPKPP